MSIRTLFSMLVALAVLFAPAFSRAGAAFAATPDHHAQMMATGHCKMAPSQSDDGKPSDHDKAGPNCCISMCMAVAIAAPVPSASAVLHDTVTSFSPPGRYHGLLAEIATPPPRLA